MTELVLKRLGTVAPLTLDFLRSVWMFIIVVVAALAILDPAQLQPILAKTVAAFTHTLPFITIAVLLVAYVKASGAETVIAKVFVGRESRMIVLAALVGGLSPFCSCEVIPFIAGLLAMGVPISAIMAFWLASPLMDPAMLFITAGGLGWEFAIAKTVAAVAIGLAAGFAIKPFAQSPIFADPAKPRSAGGSCCSSKPYSGAPVWQFWIEADRRATFRDQSIENAIFLGKWLLLAYLLEAMLITYLPAQWVAQYVGGSGPMPIILGALVGLPAYLNGYAAVPLVAGLMEQGMSPGAAMSFLMAGSVSCIPAMAAVYSLVKFRVFAAYVVLGLVGAMLSGGAFALYVGSA
ncbi:MAG: permease [Pseudomonadota bacterium]